MARASPLCSSCFVALRGHQSCREGGNGGEGGGGGRRRGRRRKQPSRPSLLQSWKFPPPHNFIFHPLYLIPSVQRLLFRETATSCLTLSVSSSYFLICRERRRKQDASQSSSDAHTAAAAAHAASFGRLCGSLGGQDRGSARRRALCQQHGHEDPSLARGPGIGELFGSQLEKHLSGFAKPDKCSEMLSKHTTPIVLKCRR